MPNGNSYPGIRIDKLDSDTVVRFIDQGEDAVVISGTLNMGSNRITHGEDPVDGKDFATKDYVDSVVIVPTGSILYKDFTEVPVSGTTTRTTVFSYTIPADLITGNRALRITTMYQVGQGIDANTYGAAFRGSLNSNDVITTS